MIIFKRQIYHHLVYVAHMHNIYFMYIIFMLSYFPFLFFSFPFECVSQNIYYCRCYKLNSCCDKTLNCFVIDINSFKYRSYAPLNPVCFISTQILFQVVLNWGKFDGAAFFSSFFGHRHWSMQRLKKQPLRNQLLELV